MEVMSREGKGRVVGGANECEVDDPLDPGRDRGVDRRPVLLDAVLGLTRGAEEQRRHPP
jgi:hypothetical protein